MALKKSSLCCLLLTVSVAFSRPVDPTTEAISVEPTSTDSTTSDTPSTDQTQESTSTDSSTTTAQGTETAVSEETVAVTISNNVEVNTISQSQPENRNDEVLETVRFPQNRIPLRLLQRNRWLPRTTTLEPDPPATQHPNSHRGGPVGNMIMDKRPTPGPSFAQENLENHLPERSPSDESDAATESAAETEPAADGQPQQSPPLERSRTSFDLHRMHPINRHFQTRHHQGQLQPMNPPLFDSAPRVDSLSDFLKALPNDKVSLTTLKATDTNSNVSTPLPLPVPLNKVPFHLWPDQEIQNQLLEAQWRRSGLNMSLYISTNTPELTTTTSTSTTTSSTTVTSTTAVPTTTDGQLHSLFAEYMANKNENAREYLKAIFENRVGGEREGLAALEQHLKKSKRVRA